MKAEILYCSKIKKEDQKWDHPKPYFGLKYQNFDEIFKKFGISNQNRASGVEWWSRWSRGVDLLVVESNYESRSRLMSREVDL